jgi:hypothetical protein
MTLLERTPPLPRFGHSTNPRSDVMPDRSDEYRNQAIYCREMADAAHSEDMKANWLLLAQKWLAMVKGSRQSAVLSTILADIGVDNWKSR